MACNCSICNKEFEYGDENSPMLKNEIWDKILNHYGIKNEEREKARLYYKLWDLYYNDAVKTKKAKKVLGEVLDSKYLHTYICTDCMEKAMGRKLSKDDMIGENVPFNEEFEKCYFNK